MVTLRHLLFVTLCFQVLNVESAEEEPVRVLFGCWPSNINNNNFLGEIQQIYLVEDLTFLSFQKKLVCGRMKPAKRLGKQLLKIRGRLFVKEHIGSSKGGL